MSFGEYPHVGPKDARELHFASRKKLLAVGVNPMGERKAEAEKPSGRRPRRSGVKLITALRK